VAQETMANSTDGPIAANHSAQRTSAPGKNPSTVFHPIIDQPVRVMSKEIQLYITPYHSWIK
jgi:hypothetical protein